VIAAVTVDNHLPLRQFSIRELAFSRSPIYVQEEVVVMAPAGGDCGGCGGGGGGGGGDGGGVGGGGDGGDVGGGGVGGGTGYFLQFSPYWSGLLYRLCFLSILRRLRSLFFRFLYFLSFFLLSSALSVRIVNKHWQRNVFERDPHKWESAIIRYH
jgi:hypothetical protein